MSKLTTSLKNLFSRDQLTADGGSVWRGPNGAFRTRRFLKLAGSSGLVAITLFAMLASIGLPLPGRVQAKRAEASEIYARDGQTLLFKLRGDQNRTSIRFEEMPTCIKQATVAVEDKAFYKHQGLDPRGFSRAVMANVQSGFGSQGGSTITQQLVKNALLSPERTITRKAKELVLSLEIEQMYSKDDILRLYLNEIPYGSSAYGIEAATQTYFGKDKRAKDLTLAQCATLAAIPKAPTFYSPFNPDKERLKNRSKYVLDEMLEEKYITAEEAAAAKAQIDAGLEYAATGVSDINAPHFVFYVREQLEQQFGTKRLEQGGLKIVTTLDKPKQDIAEEVIKTAARTRFAGYGASNAALTSIDPKNGDVLAMVGSVDYFDTAAEGNVNVATSERQPGSSIKPIIYLAGFQNGKANNAAKTALNPATLLWDVKTDFGGGYAPNNYDQKNRGPVSARESLQQSLNVTSVKMLDLVGLDNALRFANDMGISSLKPQNADRYGLSLVLGGGEVRLVDLTSAYAVMANEGKKAPTRSILNVTDRNNKVLFNAPEAPPTKEIVSPALAGQMTDVLKDDEARAPAFGRGGPLTLPGREVAAKTGTTDSYRDAWTVGYTPSLTAGVWLGNNDNSPMNQVGGSIGAAPIWQEYMRRALAEDQGRAQATKFERPGGLKEMKVDRLTGLKPKPGAATKNELFTSENEPTDASPTAANACGAQASGTGGLTSERPDNPAWETPVQTFIKSRGIPSGARSTTNEECGPEVSITTPGDGSTVEGTITIQARATSDRGIKSVEFSYDGKPIGSADAPPFTMSYQIPDTSGQHTISAKATDGDGNSKTATITVNVGSASPEPGAGDISLTCTTARLCTARSNAPLTNPILVNADNPGQTVPMSKAATQTYTATAPAGWQKAFAQGTDPDGQTVKSSNAEFTTAGVGGGGNPAERGVRRRGDTADG